MQNGMFQISAIGVLTRVSLNEDLCETSNRSDRGDAVADTNENMLNYREVKSLI